MEIRLFNNATKAFKFVKTLETPYRVLVQDGHGNKKFKSIKKAIKYVELLQGHYIEEEITSEDENKSKKSEARNNSKKIAEISKAIFEKDDTNVMKMTTAHQYAAIYDRLNNQPHLQELIATPILQELEDKDKLYKNTSKTGLPTSIFSDGTKMYDSSKYYKKLARKDPTFKTHVKFLKKSEQLAEKTSCNPYPSYDVFMEFKVHLADINYEAKLEHPTSKQKRDKYITEGFYKRMLDNVE